MAISYNSKKIIINKSLFIYLKRSLYLNFIITLNFFNICKFFLFVKRKNIMGENGGIRSSFRSDNTFISKFKALNISQKKSAVRGEEDYSFSNNNPSSTSPNNILNFIHILVSWSLQDIFNQHLYKTKVHLLFPSSPHFSSCIKRLINCYPKIKEEER